MNGCSTDAVFLLARGSRRTNTQPHVDRRLHTDMCTGDVHHLGTQEVVPGDWVWSSPLPSILHQKPPQAFSNLATAGTSF